MMMTILLWTLAILFIFSGYVGLILPGLPGPPLLFIGFLLAAWAEQFSYVGTTTLIILGIMAGLAALLDYVAAAYGAKRFGASSHALIGATLGTLVGLFFGLLGILLGPFIGAVIGELTNQRNLFAAGRAGIGTTLGLVLATAAKLALGFAMLGLFLLVRFI